MPVFANEYNFMGSPIETFYFKEYKDIRAGLESCTELQSLEEDTLNKDNNVRTLPIKLNDKQVEYDSLSDDRY